MADLNVKVLKRSLTRNANKPGPDVVARVRRLDGKGGETSVAVSIGEQETPILGLEDGFYEVQLHLPSGNVLAQQIELGSDARTLEFDAGESPAPYLGWQHLSGAVPGIGPSSSGNLKDFASPRGNSPETFFERDEEVFYTKSIGGALSIGPNQPKLLMIEAPAGNEFSAIDRIRIRETWELLAGGVARGLKPVSMVRGFHRATQRPDYSSEDHEAWRFGFNPAQELGKRPPRRFALVRIGSTHELVSLPLPWRSPSGGDEAIVDLLVDESETKRSFRSSVTIQDDDYGGLVAYMNTGSLGLAGELIRDGCAISGKTLALLHSEEESPLGAIAAAYALLGTARLECEQEVRIWQEWMASLEFNRWLGWVPDASILCARLQLLLAETKDQTEPAIHHVHRALQHGLPFYSLGLAWLLEAMSFLKEDPLIAETYPHADKVARHLDVSQAFLVLKLRKGS
jgi:hypothetical protein